MYVACIRALALVGFFAASPLEAQTTEQDLPRRNQEMAWPAGLDPSKADVFNHNHLAMEQSCEAVYSWLSAPQDWHLWLTFVRDVQLIELDRPMDRGSRFKWTIFDLPLEADVFVAEPGRRFGYTLTPPGPPPQYAQSWLFTPQGSGCMVTTEEVGIGELARKASNTGDLNVHIAHELWLASLRYVSRSGKRPVD